ncbi:MAG TPA: restriction endonuclease subunit S [Saprospiraceae bacterium]|nr:restriction endonuclease subunit S [Saprospiraceae bacterium]
MNNEIKLVPKLRFPEFNKDKEWQLTTIGEVGKFYYGKSAPKWSLSSDAPTLCVRYGELYTKFDTIISKIYSRTNIDPSNLKFSKGGEILVPRVGEIPQDFAKHCCYLPFPSIAIGEMISVYETAEYPIFYAYYFRTLWKQFAEVVEGQNVKNLYYVNLEPIFVGKPSYLEQQKIAACLSSLDDVITAESQKLEMLKEHKKGLLQNLFPQEGETVPRLRFKEYRYAGNWKPETLGQVCDVRDGTHDSPKFFNTGKPLVTSKNLLSDGTLDLVNTSLISEQDYEQINKRSRVDVGDILFGMIGTIGNPVMVNNDGFAIKNVALIKQKHKLLNKFLVQLLNSGYIVAKLSVLNKGNAQKFIALGVLRNLEILYPLPEEQQKIADCLSSLDELIYANNQKVEDLKLHKKGLLQGLFPEINEII